MGSPFIAEIKIWGGNFAPKSYAFCNGQLISISQNTALFSLIGVNYGGNGQTTFGLPDFRGRAPIHFGQGPGLSQYVVGQVGGTTTETLISTELPSHNHAPNCLSTSPNPTPSLDPTGNVWAVAGSRRAMVSLYKAPPPGTTANLHPAAIGFVGGNQPHNNMQPYLVLSFIIALQGVYPARN